jgi:hypothetical protein
MAISFREGQSRNGRAMTVAEVRSDRPIPPAKDSGRVKTIVIRRDSNGAIVPKTL